MKTFMDYLAEATMDRVEAPESGASPLLAAFEAAFPAGKVKGSGRFIPSGDQDIRGQKVSSAFGIVAGANGSRWQDIKRVVEAEIAQFPSFEQSEHQRGKMPFINSDNPVVRINEKGMRLLWFRPRDEMGMHDAWRVPQTSDDLKQAG